VSSTNQVDNELAAMKAEIGTGSGSGGDGAAALPAAEHGVPATEQGGTGGGEGA